MAFEVLWRSREDEAFSAGYSYPEGEYPEVIKKLLFARGISKAEIIEDLFQPKLAQLKNPFLIHEMDVAADRMLQAFRNNEKICLYADFDLDGTSGLALLSEGLVSLGFQNIQLHQPKRLADGYGFHASTVKELSQKGVQLIITIDVGITALEAVQAAYDFGMDVIITDHHQPSDVLPRAYAVVNPNKKSDQSDLGYLCGAGVAFYLLRAVFKRMQDEGILTSKDFDLKSVLDFFTIGTITDMVPLIGDNRILTKFGLVQLAQTNRPGLRALLNELKLDQKTLSAQDVGIRFAPKLNALSRMEKGILPIDLMLEKNSDSAAEKVKFVMTNNDDRVAAQSEGEKEALEFLQTWPYKDFFFFSSQNVHRGVAGLIATKMTQKTGWPCFIGSELPDNNLIVGSARVPNGSSESVLSALKFSEGCLTRFGGHHAASGFELFFDSKENLSNRLDEYFKQKDSEIKTSIVEFDFDLQISQVQPGFMKWLEALGPFGQGFPTPLFRLKKYRLDQMLEMKGGHLRLSTVEEGVKIDALYFSPPPNLSLQLGSTVDMLVELQWNYFMGRKSIQLLVKELRKNRDEIRQT